MSFAIDLAKLIIWFPLELLVIATLLRGQYRRFPFILAYVVAEFLVVAAEIPAYWAVYTKAKDAWGQQFWLYSFDEIILQLLIYSVVISLIYKATESIESRRTVRFSVICGAFVFAGASFAYHYLSGHASIAAWMTPWTRDLNFCSVILDLALWGLLISSKKKDYRLLLVSGGLGIRFTGEAIGDSLRELASRRRLHGLSYSGSLLITLVDLLCLYIWWQAFREKATAPVEGSEPVRGFEKGAARFAAPFEKHRFLTPICPESAACPAGYGWRSPRYPAMRRDRRR